MRGSLSERLAAGSIPEPNSGCLLWMKAGTSHGRYGAIRDGKTAVLTHRAAWICAKGPIPEGLHVLHKCDVGFCVNPNHLFLGSHDDNMADKARKGRAPIKHNAETVNEIRDLASRGYSHIGIADKLGIPRPTVSEIVRGEKRRYVT